MYAGVVAGQVRAKWVEVILFGMGNVLWRVCPSVGPEDVLDLFLFQLPH